MTFYIKQGDTSPAIKYQLQDHEGNPINLQGNQEIRFHMKKTDIKQEIINDAQNTESTDLKNGIVKYEWQNGDTDKPGKYEAEFEVTFSGGKTETFPHRRDIQVQIEEQIS